MNRQDACSTKSELSWGTGILPVLENGALRWVLNCFAPGSKSGGAVVGKSALPQVRYNARVEFLAVSNSAIDSAICPSLNLTIPAEGKLEFIPVAIGFSASSQSILDLRFEIKELKHWPRISWWYKPPDLSVESIPFLKSKILKPPHLSVGLI